MSGSSNIAVGSQVWVADPEEAWIDGEVLKVNGDEIKVKCSSGKTVAANASDTYPKDPEDLPNGVDDMTKLAYLHEPGVLQNLKSRYFANEIYTYTGNILIAVNPFQRLPHLYSGETMQKYKGMQLGELSPHPFAIADSAYRRMVNDGISQSILVSGESGAGKTESTKMLMCYLAYMGAGAGDGGRSVQEKVLESSPVLEGFGNAKTVRNNNSSRFGKFVEIQFNNSGRISGAAIRTYLLERSRVCQVSDPERNYHCFYMLCAAPPEDREKYKVGNPREFHYLNQSNCYELNGVDNSQEYLDTRRAMDIVGMSSDEQDAIFRVVAAVLHLGNIEFGKVSDGDASKPKDDKSKLHLKTTAELLKCDEKALEDSLCKRVMVTRDETITKSLNPDDAALSRDALAKIVYSRLFDWLVNKINDSISQDPNSKYIIGVLDIYGFESFKTNSFEQFCINLTNEKLQQHFNQHVFKMEQEEYTKEEIDWSYIEFVDNQDILDLIERKPGGLIALLDEACMFPRSTHETFSEKLYQTFKDHKRFSKPKLSRTGFTISHYAGDVTYQTDLFLDKNKDYVIAEHQALLSASGCSFVSGLFPPLPEESSKSSKFSSIGSRFKMQLQSLLEILNATEPHYVRCIKPNNLLKPSIFENANALQQLRCGGVMEAIRISCAGYPTRKTFQEFIQRFKILDQSVLHGSYDDITGCRQILEKSGLKGYQIGKTKVFLRAGQMPELDACRARVLGRSACIIQRKYRSYYARNYFLKLRSAAVYIQALCRGQIARHIFECKRRMAAALIIQKDIRMHFSRKTYVTLYNSAVMVQTGMRGMDARNTLRFLKQKKAATIIQTECRRYLASNRYSRLKWAAISLQCACRSCIALEELRKLRMAARETAALQDAIVKLEEEFQELMIQLEEEKRKREDIEEAKATLEKQVKELTLQLQMEKSMRVDVEEAKNYENAELQSTLEEMQKQIQQFESDLEEMQNLQVQFQDGGDNSPKTNLEKQVKELTIQLQQEKKKRVDIEEAKSLEIKRLQSSLEEVKKFGIAKEQLIKEPEAAKMVSNQVPSVEDVSITGDELIDKLRAENANLKLLVISLEKQASDTESKITQLQAEIQRFLFPQILIPYSIASIGTFFVWVKSSNGHQNSVNSPAGKQSEHQNTEAVENDPHHDPQSATPTKKYGTESDSELRNSHIERQRENIDTCIRCIENDLGFSEKKPVAAFTIYKCLINWKSFEAEKTNIFDRLIQIVGSALEDEADTKRLAYWLSNASTLFFLLDRTLKDPSAKQPASFFERVAQGFRSSPAINIGGFDGVQQVEAKYPAILFKEQLAAYVETIYGLLRDNAKKELFQLLSLIQVPKALVDSSSDQSSKDSSMRHWQSIIDVLNGFLSLLKDNFVPLVIVQHLFTDIFSYVNVQLCNSILQQKECCTVSHGEYIKAGLAELQLWSGNSNEHAGSAWDELKHVQQAVRLLALQEKSELNLDDLTTELCPSLSHQQLHRICTLYTDENSSTGIVPQDVISSLKPDSDDSNEAGKDSYLLDENSGTPMSIQNISNSINDLDFTGVKPPAELLENPGFEFLKG
ncbi:myosin-8-like [Andrographis paniculata]|uniref:myosin-8-like n=1 Tax=Andrographis paniculata TaxID=175694 RepID=UPI0021E94B3C|nr:myosin-8-like [Andrographis paniculata]